MEMNEHHKAGFVNIIGKPNVGKSTLINALIGEKVSIVSPKVQTTRHRILGIINGDDFQVIFSDTPGIIDQPKYMLQEAMMRFVHDALADADVVFYMVDNTESPEVEQPLLNNIMREGLPLFIVINKIDKMNQEEVVALMNRWKQVVREDQIIPVSATKGFNLQSIIQAAKDNLPENPPYFDKEMYTDRSERFLASEVIREKIYNRTRQEIPYSTEVIVTSFKEEETIIKIAAEIFVNRESQKPILIGRGGELMKKIGTDARKELEEVYGKKVFLELYVKVKEDWRENPNMLRQFGYES